MNFNILMPQVKHRVGRKKKACVCRITGERKAANAGFDRCVRLATQTPWVILPLVTVEDNKHIFVKF